MPIAAKYLADFYEGNIYHVFNRTNNKELLFLSEENRRFFLHKYQHYLSVYADTFCWCLLPTHFHLLIRIKPYKEIFDKLYQHKDNLTATALAFLKDEITLSELVEGAFKNFFQSYALAFNKQHNRKGNLFYKPFKRVHVDQETQFTQTVVYIHANAFKHGIEKDLTKYNWSSYNSIISSGTTDLAREEVLSWFGGIEMFIKTHKELARYYYDNEIME